MVNKIVDLIPYSTQSISEDDLDAVHAVLTSGWLTQGQVVPTFEQDFARQHEVSHAVAVSSATAGLHLGCLALGAAPGKLVWTSPNSFVASANCACYCGAEVDFVDIDPITRNMSVAELGAKLEHADRVGRLPTIVIPVHFGGLPCDLKPIHQLATRYGFKILEDASHAVGATYNNLPIGSCYVDASVFSFHAVKIITTGEGGMVTTNDERIARRLRLLRSHGVTREPSEMDQAAVGIWHYEQIDLGFNYRMTEIQAALGCSQLQRVHGFRLKREALAARYDQLLAGLPLRLPTRVPGPGATACPSWHLYAVEVLPRSKVANRSEVFAALRAVGIGVNVHYEPITLQPYYRRLGFRPGQFPVAEAYAAQALSIPLFPALTENQQDQVVTELQRALKR